MATMDEIDRQFTSGFNAALELREQDQFDECIEALRKLLAHHAIPRYHRMRCLTMLACTLEDWHEAYTCYVEGESLWRLAKAWYRIFPAPAANKALDDLHESLEDIKEALVNDEERPEDTPVPDVEADVLRAMRESTLVVNQDRETPVAEGEAGDEDEMSGEDMSNEEMSNEEEEDEESKLEVETKVGDDKEGKVTRVDEE